MDNGTPSEDDKRQRDLWLLALGAALADDKWRPRLAWYVGAGLTDLAAALRKGDAKWAWRELKKWGIVQEGRELAVEALFAELDACERRRKVVHAVSDLYRVTIDGDECGIEAMAKQVLEVLKNGRVE